MVIDKFLQEALSHSMRVRCFTVWATPVMVGELIARVVVIFKHPIEAWTQWIINSGCYKSRDLKPGGKREGEVDIVVFCWFKWWDVVGSTWNVITMPATDQLLGMKGHHITTTGVEWISKAPGTSV